MQPIIRGIQAVGGVDILYRFNGKDGKLSLPTNAISLGNSADVKGDGEAVQYSEIETDPFIRLAGFRLDGEFLRATQQIASSVVIPILGGGGVALTNNNRTGTLNINCTKVSSPSAGDYVEASGEGAAAIPAHWGDHPGEMLKGTGFGPVGNDDPVYDMTLIAQAQQAQAGGDSVGSTIAVCFQFCGAVTIVQFEGCTIASVDPVGLSGNDAVNYNVAINYLNWKVAYNQDTPMLLAD